METCQTQARFHNRLDSRSFFKFSQPSLCVSSQPSSKPPRWEFPFWSSHSHLHSRSFLHFSFHLSVSIWRAQSKLPLNLNMKPVLAHPAERKVNSPLKVFMKNKKVWRGTRGGSIRTAGLLLHHSLHYY